MADDGMAIEWRVALTSSRSVVWRAISTDGGREQFWAERSETTGPGTLRLTFPNGETSTVQIREMRSPSLMEFVYFGALTRLELMRAKEGGTVVTLTARGVSPAAAMDLHAGWVSVLLALKAAVDHHIDLRNHRRDRTWDTGFCDN
jgi:uncharacterized protein YndB with AHSA1/START domain